MIEKTLLVFARNITAVSPHQKVALLSRQRWAEGQDVDGHANHIPDSCPPHRTGPHMPAPQAAYIEIIEKRQRKLNDDDIEVVVPNDVRINGTSILVPEGQSIRIHDMELGDDIVLVTLTLFARRIEIKGEDPEATHQITINTEL